MITLSFLIRFPGEWQKDMRQCVELKTNMAMESHRQRSNFERYASALNKAVNRLISSAYIHMTESL